MTARRALSLSRGPPPTIIRSRRIDVYYSNSDIVLFKVPGDRRSVAARGPRPWRALAGRARAPRGRCVPGVRGRRDRVARAQVQRRDGERAHTPGSAGSRCR